MFQALNPIPLNLKPKPKGFRVVGSAATSTSTGAQLVATFWGCICGFRKIRGTFLGVPIGKIESFRV